MPADDTLSPFASIIDDLLSGQRHSRSTIREKTGKSFAAADRWLKIIGELPGAQKRKEGRTTWVTLRGMGPVPTRPATIGACIATSLAALFEGTENERNLRDARDYMLGVRGDKYEDLDRKFVFAPRGGEYALPENADNLDEIVEAILKTKKLRFTYTHNDRKSESLLVAPLSLLVFDHQFYVLCRRDDGTFYCYRFARIAHADATARAFSYPAKHEYDPRRVLEPGFGVHISGSGPVLDIDISLREPWATFALKHRWHPTQEVLANGDGCVVLKLRVRHCREVETWILGFGEHATVLQPASLRDAIATRVAHMASVYGVSGADGPAVSKVKRRPGKGPRGANPKRPPDRRHAARSLKKA